MQRTKEWWAVLNAYERRQLCSIERQKHNPGWLVGPRSLRYAARLIAKADDAVIAARAPEEEQQT